MKSTFKSLLLFTLISLVLLSCKTSNENKNNFVVIGMNADIETLNPLFIMQESESNISELIYLGLVGHDWDNSTGNVTSYPLLAKELNWNNDSTSITITLNDAKWSDGTVVSSDDVVFSFDLYSDPKVQSRFFGIFKNYYTKPDLSIDLQKSFTVISQNQFKINFIPQGTPSYFDFDMPIVPKHIFTKIKREELATSDINFKPVGCGPFMLETWNKSQNIKLIKNKKSFIKTDESIHSIIFKIIPDYNSRITQLKKGELDFAQNIRPEDVSGLKELNSFNIVARKGRIYDYLGLNNIDPLKSGKTSNQYPNKYFGNLNIRKALALAINRQSILKEFLLNNGELMITPIAPIFKSYFDESLLPINYNPSEAKNILIKEGWIDKNGDGILEKDKNKFSFTISVPAGNPLRNYSATIIQNNLKSIGIETKLEVLEPNIFFQKMFKKQLDAWIAGWGVPIPIDLKPYWYSDPQIGNANVYSYKNPSIDNILLKLETKIHGNEKSSLIKEFQKIIYNDQPVVFLYWIDDLVAVSKRIENVQINPLGAIQKCWSWKLSE